MPNYSFKNLPTLSNGDTIEGANLTRLEPRTAIYTGVTGLTFRNCNLTNCILPADAVQESCMQTQIDFCSNLRPELVAKGLAQCAENCAHVTSTDTVQEGGVTVATVYHYEATWLGKV